MTYIAAINGREVGVIEFMYGYIVADTPTIDGTWRTYVTDNFDSAVQFISDQTSPERKAS